MRLAVVQLRDAPPDTAANLARCLRFLQEAADRGADLVVFPEMALTGYYLDQEMARRAASVAPAFARVRAAVDQLGLSAVIGLPLFQGEALLNAVAVLRPGVEPELYAKTHLFRREKEWFTPGARLWHGEVAGWHCGILHCYEIGFPEIARSLALQGARLFLAPAAFGRPRELIWNTMTIARALENTAYLAAAAQAGTSGNISFLGHSRIVDPLGHILAEADEEETLIVADLDPDVIASVRRGRSDANDYLADRRPELYEPVTRPPAEPPRSANSDSTALAY